MECMFNVFIFFAVQDCQFLNFVLTSTDAGVSLCCDGNLKHGYTRKPILGERRNISAYDYE